MGRKKKTEEKRSGYFYEAEQEAVVQYLNCTDEEEKNKIFRNILYPAFVKMIESIIRRYKLFTPDEEFETTFDDTISFLMSKINHYKPDSGYKAYSYCGTVCKNYLIWKINQYNKNLLRNDSFEQKTAELENNLKYSYGEQTDKETFLSELLKSMAAKIQDMIDNSEKNKLKENDVKVGQALILLFDNWEEMFARMGTNKFNKSSVILFIQEITLLSQKEVKASISKFKKVYSSVKSDVVSIYL